MCSWFLWLVHGWCSAWHLRPARVSGFSHLHSLHILTGQLHYWGSDRISMDYFLIFARHVLLRTFQCLSPDLDSHYSQTAFHCQMCWQLLEKSLQLQDKYKKKKAKKYLNHVTLIRPCARSLADFYFQKMPMKIAGMRSDTLAILLSLANISADSRTLVVDSVGGLVAGEYNLFTEIVSLLLSSQQWSWTWLWNSMDLNGFYTARSGTYQYCIRWSLTWCPQKACLFMHIDIYLLQCIVHCLATKERHGESAWSPKIFSQFRKICRSYSLRIALLVLKTSTRMWYIVDLLRTPSR